jgi:hypothetical protein
MFGQKVTKTWLSLIQKQKWPKTVPSIEFYHYMFFKLLSPVKGKDIEDLSSGVNLDRSTPWYKFLKETENQKYYAKKEREKRIYAQDYNAKIMRKTATFGLHSGHDPKVIEDVILTKLR